jgi:TonB family protein
MLITKVSGATVEFPADAVRAGVTSGYVRARVRIDANGVPADVTIVESRPNRVFDRAVKNTLSLWRFNPGADNRVYEAQIDFNR